QIKKHYRRRNFLRQLLYARGCGMEPQLQRVEVEAVVLHNDDLAIQDAARREHLAQRLVQLGEKTVQKLLVPALDQDFVAIAKNQCAKTIPFGLEDPITFRGKLVHTLGEHGQDRWIHGQVHASWYTDRVPSGDMAAGHQSCNRTFKRVNNPARARMIAVKT